MKLFRELKYQIWTVVWTVVIFIFCNMRMPDTSGSGIFFEGFDKLVHLGFFYVFTVLLFYGKIRQQHNYSFRISTIFKVVFAGAALGGIIEILQWQVFTYRSAEWWDFGCDMLGVAMGVFSYVLLHAGNYNKP